MKIRVDKVDAVFSKLIRLRDGYTCKVCGKYYVDGHGLQCSHFWSRRHQATRYDPDNACAMDFRCHQDMGANPIKFARWVFNFLGEGRYLMLEEKHKQIVKRTKKDKAALYEHLKSELAKLEAAVAEGSELPPVVSWD